MTSEPHEETILVIAKTYPECSKKYGCLVCIAGINEEGEWRRLYPIPFHVFYQSKYEGLRFKKFDLISATLQRAPHDRRKESYKIVDPYKITIEGSIEDWEERRKVASEHLDSGFSKLGDDNRSLGIIKPKDVQDFIMQQRMRIKDEGEKVVLDKTIQTLLPEFPEADSKGPFRPMELPWLGYSYTCHDEDCNGHKMMCIDWEIQELYRKLRKEGEKMAFQKTRDKALWMVERDLYFCVGTTWRFPSWMIISLIYPPKVAQTTLAGEPEISP